MASPAEPRLPRSVRATLPEGAPRRVLFRALGWALAQGLVTLALTRVTGLPPALGFGLALGAGLLASQLPRLAALPAAALVAGLAWAASGLGLSPILTAGAAAGTLAVALAQGAGGGRALQGAFAGAAAAGLGARLAAELLAPLAPGLAQAGLEGAITGLLAAQGLWVAAIRWIASDRLPSRAAIDRTLPAELREPCYRALALDRALAAQTPDPDTRDGLGEVAAWVYRLSWTLAALGRELGALEPERVEARLAEAKKSAEEASDPLTREPREATARHLEQLVQHRDALRLEQQRTSALIEYALAFLEQARAGLALARVRPGEGMPERLGDVLDRLRSQTAEGDARRRTARQLTPLA